MRFLDRFDSVLLVLAALLIALLVTPTLLYPYGADQAVFHYVAMAWREGVLPYRDTLDHKFPLIYLIYLIADLVAGSSRVTIRIFEILLVVGVGWAIAVSFSRAGRERTALWLLILAIVFGSYFVPCTFWDTAQAELWISAGVVLSALGVRIECITARRALGSGALLGFACLAKPIAVAAYPALIGALLIGRRDPSRDRSPRSVVVAVCWFTVGALLPVFAMLAYFGSNGALVEVWQVLVEANLHYAQFDRRVSEPEAIIAAILYGLGRFSLIGLVAVIGIVVSIARAVRERSRAALQDVWLTVSLPLAMLAAVTLQFKFWSYHWAAFPCVFALCSAPMLRAGLAFLRGRLPRQRFSGAAAFLGVALLLGGVLFGTGDGARMVEAIRRTGDALRGASGWYEWLRWHSEQAPYGDLVRSEIVGQWLQRNVPPGTSVTVRGFDAYPLVRSRTLSPSRFFITNWIVDPTRKIYRDAWLTEDRRALELYPPRFMIVLDGSGSDVDNARPYISGEYFGVRYRPRLRVLGCLILERGDEDVHARGE